MGTTGAIRMKEEDGQKPAKPLDVTEAHLELFELLEKGGEKALREYAERKVREREGRDKARE
jgi:hypothetical protein